ncbi:MAG TPA: hypothetical protein VGZ47_21860 [Gemmataceae bacterium]|jgi:hypothetical protein|nr:hypothetical protein [Gemmataceae bacterium]
MKRITSIALATAGLFIIASAVQAQQPSVGGTNMQFVPVDTSKNLAAPIPSVPTLQKPAPPKKPLLARIGDRIGALNPFRPKPAAAKAPGPVSPTTQLPKDQQPPATTPPLSLPQIPPVVQGTIH